MRIATLQFAPKLGDVEGNIRRAEELLKRGTRRNGRDRDGVEEVGGDGGGCGIEELRPEILVLPELAFTGYNFPSLEAITPYLEPVGEGPTAKWARETAKRLRCKVCVGYPEIQRASSLSSSSDQEPPVGTRPPADGDKCFNSLLVVDDDGQILLNYRKRFLYYTDETWASEGDAGWGYHSFTFGERQPQHQSKSSSSSSNDENPVVSVPKQKRVPTTFGICMDINPYRFEAPFTAWEFANRVLDSQSQLVILSMAWLTLLGPEELAALGRRPDMDTFNYWIRRFWPLIEKKMGHEGDIDDESYHEHGHGNNEGEVVGPPMHKKKVVIVFANRCGEEKGGPEDKPPTARYAGTSAVIAVTQQQPYVADGDKDGENKKEFDVKILCWDMMGAGEEGICFADTRAEPKTVFGLVRRQSSESGESE
ncbi:carbon-nitrogen hydrolase [Thermoascus aurantiacus ATCC 26904]